MPQDWLAHPGTAGSAWPNTELLIADDDGNECPPGGEQIKAVIQPAAGQQPGPELAAGLMASLAGRLAKMKWPKSIDFIADMPRDPSGKLRKRLLRDPYWVGRERVI